MPRIATWRILVLIAIAYSALLVVWSPIVAIISLGPSVLVELAFAVSSRSGGNRALFAGTALAWMFLAYALVGLVSIAPFYVPTALALVLAAYSIGRDHDRQVPQGDWDSALTD